MKYFIVLALYLNISFLFAALLPSHALASSRTFYVDINTQDSAKQDGSVENPWNSVEDALGGNTVRGGDTVILRKGNYGNLIIENLRNEESITIKAQDGHNVQFSGIQIYASSNWGIKGLIINGSSEQGKRKRHLVTIDKKSDRILLSDLSIKSTTDTKLWTDEDWTSKASNGIFSQGTNIVIRNNLIRNINHGIWILGEQTLVSGNTVDYFSGDGMLGLANHLIFEDNLVKNCVEVDDNHDDGFQSWTKGSDGKVGTGTISDVILRRNSFINSVPPDKESECDMQGIGLFDGIYENWVIENNLIVVDHWHGISVMGAKNVKIVNNTVYDPNTRRPGPAWIQIFSHKNGTESTDSLIANNIAGSFGKKMYGVLYTGNMVLRNAQSVFRDAESLDFELSPDSIAKQGANPDYLPETDLKGRKRQKNGTGDIGAFQTP
ncbi:right-handed parallel beta-helix repeat-containing protein [Sneathiella marina]|uniref:Right-handed parallel beta-helix repeat-containing protein n=1 Tax=Sneathiella marina TaxID=2950108 RepID=A0ABY4W2X3_9PROT|nr:right-handed parallel beta-helix repeat-containing protein [Sneathiella marina]USG61312.1 right-handed parallel beta-helix repeat-containing protein [Sneathiella marina]